jgi:serine/threonine protein kinase
MAPEIINPVTNTSIKYTNKSDIWAIGITFYEMLYGRTPWKAKS